MATSSDVIDALDEEPLPGQAAREIAFELIKSIGLNDADSLQMMNDYVEGRLNNRALTPVAETICAKRMDYTLSNYERSKCFLLCCLTPISEPLDGYFAEYIFGWAEDLGIHEPTVITAFRDRMS